MGSFDATVSHIPLITCHGLPQVHFTMLCLQKQSKKETKNNQPKTELAFQLPASAVNRFLVAFLN